MGLAKGNLTRRHQFVLGLVLVLPLLVTLGKCSFLPTSEFLSRVVSLAEVAEFSPDMEHRLLYVLTVPLGAILVVLCRRDYYGYELVHTISENIDIAEGTIYPLLRRLTKEGYFTTYLRESEEGPSRKYYQITDKGQTYKEQLLSEWNQFVSSVNNLIVEEKTA